MVEPTSPVTHQLRPDTQAVLLLCGRFDKQPNAEAKPLTQSEYDKLAEWLRGHDMRPANLLTAEGFSRLESAEPALPLGLSRLKLLLERGGGMALAVESWSSKGLWVISRSDDAYPRRLREGRAGPPILYGAGNPQLLALGGLAIVGSRNVTEAEVDYTHRVAQACAANEMQLVSGGARGVDTEAMLAALAAGGSAVGVLSDSLLKTAVSGKYRSALLAGHLALISPYDPGAGFEVGMAMGRNKYIYTLADYALVISASAETGGTWSGAVEALKSGKRSIFVRAGGNDDAIPDGNIKLLDKGALPFPSEPWDNLANSLLVVESNRAADRPQESQVAEKKSPGAVQSTEPSGLTYQRQEAHRRGGATTQTQHVEGPPQPGAGEESASLYRIILPMILSQLSSPTEAKVLAESLGVRQAQLQDWLERAVEEGSVTKLQKPVRYVASAPPAQVQMELM